MFRSSLLTPDRAFAMRRVVDFLSAACKLLAGLAGLWILLFDRLCDFIYGDDEPPPPPSYQ